MRVFRAAMVGLAGSALVLCSGSAWAASLPAPVIPRRITAADVDGALEAARGRSPMGAAKDASDEVFLRRIYLDLVGVVPSVAAFTNFRASTAPDRRVRLVDLLLDTRRFRERWAELLRTLILGRKPNRNPKELATFEAWLANRLSKPQVGLDRIVREILTAEGTVMDNPATNYIASFENNTDDMTGRSAKLFLGIQMQCAQCHDHPFQQWTRADFMGMRAFFARQRGMRIPVEGYERLRKGEITQVDQLAYYLPPGMSPPRDPKAPATRRIQRIIDRLRARWASEASDPLAYRGATTLEQAADEMGMTEQYQQVAMAKNLPKELTLIFEAPDGELRLKPEDEAEVPMSMASSATPVTSAPAPVPTPKPTPTPTPTPKPKPAPRKPGQRLTDFYPNRKPASPRPPQPPPIPPRFLDGTSPPASGPGVDRRELLARWITAGSNPFFARAMANRLWALMLGRGLVEPVDDVFAGHERTHERLLDRLAGHLVATDFDLRDFLRLIATTRTYQRAIASKSRSSKGPFCFEHALVRPLDPEQVFASILESTDAERLFTKGAGPQFAQMRERFVSQYVHAAQNDEPGESTSFQGSISQALFLLNGPELNRAVQAVKGLAVDQLRTLQAPEDRLTQLMRRTLTRDPTAAELKFMVERVRVRSAAPGPPAAPQALPRRGSQKAGTIPLARRLDAMWRTYEDVMWALLASTEFLTNH